MYPLGTDGRRRDGFNYALSKRAVLGRDYDTV